MIEKLFVVISNELMFFFKAFVNDFDLKALETYRSF